jgi:hypothetical protein
MTIASSTTGLSESNIHTMVRSALMAIPIDPACTEADKNHLKEDVASTLITLAPRDPAEAMLAVRAVIAHHASVELLRRAFHTDVTPAEADRLCARHTALSNLAARLQRELRQLHTTHPVARPAPKAEPAPTVVAAEVATAPVTPRPVQVPHVPQAQPTAPKTHIADKVPANTPPPLPLAA